MKSHNMSESVEVQKKKILLPAYKRILFFVFWTYIFIKLFLFDIERKLLSQWGIGDHWILNYRILLLLITTSIVWFYLGNKRFWKNLGLLTVYPFILLLWDMPKLFLWRISNMFYQRKKWLLMYAYVNAWINSIYLFKINLLTWSLFFLSVVLINHSEEDYLLWLSFTFLLILLLFHLYNRIKLAFSPIRMFRVNLHILSMKDGSKKNSLIESSLYEYKSITEGDEPDQAKVEEKKVHAMQNLMFIHQSFNFIRKRLNEFKQTRVYMIAFLIKVLTTFILCLVLLSLMNFSLYRISPDHFNVGQGVHFFDFFYYTFHSILLSSVEVISPSSSYAQAINMLAPLTGLIITVILISVYFSVTGERYRENIDDVVTYSDKLIVDIEKAIQVAFGLGIQEALDFLKKAQSSVYNLFFSEIKKIE